MTNTSKKESASLAEDTARSAGRAAGERGVISQCPYTRKQAKLRKAWMEEYRIGAMNAAGGRR